MRRSALAASWTSETKILWSRSKKEPKALLSISDSGLQALLTSSESACTIFEQPKIMC